MGLILLCILVFLGLVIPKSKGVTTAILIFMWVLFAFNLQSPDRGSYETAYNNLFEVRIYMTNYEPAYTLLMIICRMLRLSYVGFRTVLATIYVVLIGVSVKRYTLRTASALALFLIAPFLWYISGLRVAISTAVVAYSFWYLLSDGRKSVIKFCIGILIATLFHYSACLYFIFLLAKNKSFNWNKFFKIVVLVSIAAFVILRTDILYTIVSTFIDRQKTLQWFIKGEDGQGNTSFMGAITSLIILLGNIYVTFKAKRCFRIYEIANSSIYRKNKYFSELIYNVNCLMLLFFPLILLSMAFLRLIYTIMILNICSVTNAMELMKIRKLNNKNSNRFIVPVVSILIVGWLILIAAYQDYSFLGTEYSAYYIITKNILFPF